MNNHKLLTFFIFLFLSFNMFGQQTLIIPQNYEDALKRDKQEGVELFVFPYENVNIDVRDMKKRYPELNSEDFVRILPPNLSFYDDVSVLMAVVSDSRSDSTALIIWLAGNYQSNEVTFFIDKFSSRSFKNAQKIKLQGGGKAKKVHVYPFGKLGRSPVEMLVSVPKNRDDDLEKLINSRKYKNLMQNRFAIGGFLGFGSGSIHHDYISTETNFPGWYDVVLSEKLVGLSVSKYFKSFKLELRGTYQNIFQYTSYYKLRYDEPEVIFTANGGRYVNENLRVETNQDQHSKHRLKLGLLAAPRIKISKQMEIQPSIGGGYIFFLNEPYLANKFEGFIDAYEQPATQFLELGLNMEMSVGKQKSLTIGFFYNMIDWKPTGFYEAIEGTDINRHYRGYNMSVGYIMGI